jgi:hypothetical protein
LSWAAVSAVLSPSTKVVISGENGGKRFAPEPTFLKRFSYSTSLESLLCT